MVQKKQRILIPRETVSNLMYDSDSTCCFCQIAGKPVQIHHIDENPANNEIENLAILCQECHDKTMIKGGFGRKLSPSLVKKYRNEWLKIVSIRRDKINELAALSKIEKGTTTKETNVVMKDTVEWHLTRSNPDSLKLYLASIVIIHKEQYAIAKLKWDTGVSSEMNQGCYDVIGFYEKILVELASFYPQNHFSNKAPNRFFNELISSMFHLYRCVEEPWGAGTGGTMINQMVGGDVMEKLRILILDIVCSLSRRYGFDFIDWKTKWMSFS